MCIELVRIWQVVSRLVGFQMKVMLGAVALYFGSRVHETGPSNLICNHMLPNILKHDLGGFSCILA